MENNEHHVGMIWLRDSIAHMFYILDSIRSGIVFGNLDTKEMEFGCHIGQPVAE